MSNNFEYFKIKLKDKEINVRNWNYSEDLELNKKITNLGEDKSKEIDIILDFLKEHTTDKELFDTLSEVDIYRILFTLRNNSKGNEIKYMWKCQNEKCTSKDQFQHTSLDIITDVKYIINKEHEEKIDSKYIINFKDISYKEKINIIKNSESMETLQYQLVLGSLESVIKNGELIIFSSIKEVDDFMKNIEPKYVYQIITAYSNKTSSIKILKKNSCPICKSEFDLTIGDFSFFL